MSNTSLDSLLKNQSVDRQASRPALPKKNTALVSLKELSLRIADRLEQLKDQYIQQFSAKIGFKKAPKNHSSRHILKRWPSDPESGPSIHKYYFSLARACELDEQVQVVTLLYIERYLTKLPAICPLHFLKLIAASAYVAQKVTLDTGIWRSNDFGLLSGLKGVELRSLELNFLTDLEFEMHVTAEDYNCYKLFLENYDHKMKVKDSFKMKSGEQQLMPTTD